MLAYIIQGNFINVCIAVYMYIFMWTNRSLAKKKRWLFFWACVLVDVLIIADSLDYYFASFEQPTFFRYVTSALGYTLRPVAIVFIMIIAMRIKMWLRCLTILLLTLNALLAFGSIPTHCMFYFDANNGFHRGPFGFFPFASSALFMLILTFGVVRIYRIGDKKESAIVFLTLVMSVVGVCMETVFHLKFILDGVGSVSIVFYYLFLHAQTYKWDALTNMLNRHAFYGDVPSFVKSAMTVASIDMNNLKKINDLQGHEKGDQAILTVATCLFDQMQPGCFLYRMGGDEFALLCPKTDVKTVQRIIENAQKEIKKAGYEIAWGLAEFKPEMDFEEVYAQSDQRMYVCKRAMKGGKGVNGSDSNLEKNKL